MFSEEVIKSVKNGSAIRAMFELGNKMRAQYGAENVYDFTLGNPDLEPDAAVIESMKKYVEEPNIHKYMPNAGFADVRATVAAYTAKESGVPVEGKNVLMIAGAAAGLNVVLKGLLNPGEEVIAIAPYFVEYGFYTKNQGGTFKTVNAVEGTFDLDVEAISAAITPKTKAIILNSPNNPTGVIYPQETLEKLAAVLSDLEAKGQTVYVVSDEPYVKIIYDGVKVPSMLAIFKNSIMVTSFSKSLALPGERIGYIVVNPNMDGADLLMDGLIICARTLGYVNAPSLFQKVIADHLDLATGVESYDERRHVLYDILKKAGFTCQMPEGAFYLFPKSPIADDKEFCQKALEYNILAVSGAGFGYPGYFRLAYCVDMESIRRSEQAWMKLGKEFGLI